MRVSGQAPERWKLLAWGIALLLVLGSFSSAPALAQFRDRDETECDEEDPEADVEGCLEQDGDNDVEAEVDNEGTGGDGVAGSNVIGSAGSGDTTINANNNSDFANAEGGDVEVSNDITVDNGPSLTVTGGNTNVVSNATGIATVNQSASPTLTLTLNQVSSSTGLSTVTNTANALNTFTATNLATGAGTVSQTIGAAVVSPTATGAGPVSGTVINATANATGVGPVTQTIAQTGNAALNNVVAPVVTTTATNTGAVTGSAPVSQTAIAVTNPAALAAAAPNRVLGRLFHRGDNDAEAEFENEAVGGDGIAGSNVIGVAGSGSSIINATNTSDFATSEGGDVEIDNVLDIDNGPQLTVTGGNTNIVANAIGVANVSQTSTPTVTLALTQNATSTGLSTVSNTATTINNFTGANVVSGTATTLQSITGASPVSPTGAGGVTPTALSVTATATSTGVGPVNQTINQTGNTTLNNFVTPVVNSVAANNASLTGAAPVVQTAAAITAPTTVAVIPPDGGNLNIAFATAGSAAIGQSASPALGFALGQSQSANSVSNVSNFTNAQSDFNALNNATGTGFVSQTISGFGPGSAVNAFANAVGVGPLTQTIIQNANTVLNNVVSPFITTTVTGGATISGTSPVAQTANAGTTPGAGP